MKHLLIIILSTFPLLLFTGGSLDAQERPEWCNGYYKGLVNSQIKVYSASGYDVEEIRDVIIERIKKEYLLKGLHIKFVSKDNKENESFDNEAILKANFITEHIEYNKNSSYPYTVYKLVQIANVPTFRRDDPACKLENVYVSGEYPFSARVFVPGMAQIYKGSKNKGIAFIVGEVAFVGGIVATECLRSSYKNKYICSHYTDHSAEQNANICSIVRNVSIAGAAALYVWNIIDGAVAKGKQQVFLGNAQIRIAPFATYNGGGLAMNINF